MRDRDLAIILAAGVAGTVLHIAVTASLIGAIVAMIGATL